MTVCFFGIYDPNYSRNSILIKGLRKNGVKVIECNAVQGRFAKYTTLIKKHWRIRKEYDIMIVAFPGYQAVILAKFLTRKPVILDAFFSIYDSEVCDRKSTKPKTLSALYYWLLDWLSCSVADKVLLDTFAHIKYFCEIFPLKKEKFIRVLVGADDEVVRFSEAKKDKEYLVVHFHGIATPLQGVRYIIEAAHLLEGENIKFNFIGNKIKRYDLNKEKSSKINFIGTVPYSKLIEIMSEADVCLGIFGDSVKTRVVIPNKVYEALAMGRAVITADTPAARELLVDGENCLFCRSGEAKDLAAKIILLKNNDKLRQTIADNGYRLFISQLTPQKVTEQLSELIKNYENKRLLRP